MIIVLGGCIAPYFYDPVNDRGLNQYLNTMQESINDSTKIYNLIKGALFSDFDNVETIMRGIDARIITNKRINY